MFDDLVPRRAQQPTQAPQGALSFDDLLPLTNHPPAEPDRYRAAAMADLDRSGGTGAGRLQRQIMQGLTFGGADEITAGLMTPFEMIRRGTWSPVEGYNYAKAREDLALERDRQRDGIAGSIAEVGAGVASGVGLTNAGLTAARALTPASGLMARSAAGLVDGAVIGGVTGALTNSGDERLSGAGQGALIGGALGGALPGIVQGVSSVASPITSNIAARMNPQGFAERQAARALTESGRTAAQITDDVALAAREGQGVFTVADALGNPGQRMLSTVSRNPGAGRTAVVDFLEGRQAEQGRRVAGALDDALGSATTARQMEAAREAARQAEARVAYGAARQQAVPVDISAAVQTADDQLRPGINQVVSVPSGIADTSVQGAVSHARRLLTDGRSMRTNFDDVFAAKVEIDSMMERATGAQREVLRPIRNELDRALERASGPYAAARNQYREASKAIEAIDVGRDAARRGRFEDTIPTFQAMKPEQQTGYRVGYGDVLTERAQTAAQGVNKARDFTSDASRAEMAAFARPGQGPLFDRRIGRENIMFETRRQAIGGSQTADNISDNAAMAASPEVLGNLLAGNIPAALRNLTVRAHAGATGNTPAVRERLAEILLSRGQNGADLATMLQRVEANEATRRQIANAVLRGALAGGATAPNAINGPGTSAK